MKHIIVLIIFCGFYQFGKTQEFSKSIEIDSKGYFVDGTFRLISSPKMNWHSKKHEVGIGPTILLANLVAPSTGKFPRLSGIQTHYRYFPNGFGSKMNLFLVGELTAQVITDRWKSSHWNESHLKYDEFKYLNREYLTLLNIGYGIDIALSKHIKIQQAISIGGYYSQSDSDELSPKAPELFNEDENINGYKNIGLTYGLNVSLKYRF